MTEIDLMRSFGSNLEDLMEYCNMTQQELADASKLSKSTISRYIHGEAMPNLKSIVNIAVALNCEYDELIDIYNLVD